MKFCINCGNKLNNDENHCNKCGNSENNIESNTLNKNIDDSNQNVNTINNNITQDDFNKLNKSKKYARISFILAIMPIISFFLWLISFIFSYSAGTFDYNGAISEISSMIFVITTILFIFSIGPGIILSFVFGIISLVYKKNLLAIISIFINCLPYFIILIIILFAIVF